MTQGIQSNPKVGEVLPVTENEGSNSFTDALGRLWIEIGDPADVGGVYLDNGITGTLRGRGDNLTVTVDETVD